MTAKTCVHCDKSYAATTEYFDRHPSCKDGLRGECKHCRRERTNASQQRIYRNRTGNEMEYVRGLVMAVCRIHRAERQRTEAAERRKQWEAMQT